MKHKKTVIATVVAGLLFVGGIGACSTDDTPEPATHTQSQQSDKPAHKAEHKKAEPKKVEHKKSDTAKHESKPAPTKTHHAPKVDPEVANATQAAKDYLDTMAFSEQGLIDQLSSSAGDGYSVSAATKAVKSLDVNWNEQAYKSAKDYLNTMSFSLNGLIRQLESSAGDGFTHDQAVYGANKAYKEQ